VRVGGIVPVTLDRSVRSGVRSILLVGFVACGGGAAPPSDPSSARVSDPSGAAASEGPSQAAASSDPAAAPPASAASPSAGAGLPTTCADKAADACTPPSAFVERLCAKPSQDIALSLFASATPFSRLYLRGKVDEFVSAEEVLALRYHGVPKNGIRVGSGNGSYDVLRWDGTCSIAVDADVLTKTRPARPRAAMLQWHRLADRTQSALIASSEAVKKAHSKRGKECKGAMSGDVSAGCEKANAALVEAVVDYVRGGGSVPAPDLP
jgi:hypothetical protein